MSLNKTFTGAVENVGGGTAMTFGSIAAKAVIANSTNVPAVPAALAGSAAFQHLRVNSANTGLEWATLSGYASTSIIYNSNTFERAALTGAIAVSQNSNATVFAGILDNGAAENNRTNLNFVSSTSATAVITDDSVNDELEITFQRAALTGDVTASANSNTTAFRTLTARSILANATNASAVPTDLQGTSQNQYLRVNALNTALEFGVIGASSPITNVGGASIGFDQTQNLGNNARVAVNKNSGATVGTRRRLNFIEGTGVTLTIADDAGNEEVDITVASSSGAAGHGIRDNGTLETQRANLNFVSSAEISAVATDDSANNETEVTFAIQDNSVNFTRMADWTEVVESGAGPFNDYARANSVGALLLSNAGNVDVTGMQTNGTGPGRMHIIGSVGGGTVDIVDNSASTATTGSRFATYKDKDIRLGEDEFALFTRADITGAIARRWVSLSHRWPFHNSSTLTEKSKIYHDGSDWETTNTLQKHVDHCEFWDDFISYENSNPELGLTSVPYHGGQVQWFGRASGTGLGDIVFIAGESNHPGIIRLNTSTTDNSSVTLHLGPATTSGFVAGSDILDFECVVRFVDTGLGSVGFSIGFSEDTSSLSITTTANSHIAAFMYDTDNANLTTSIRCITREADGTATNTASGVAPTGWKKLRILQLTEGTMEFFIDDVLVATHSTQVPDSGEIMNLGVTLVTRTTDIRDLDIDYIGFTSQPLNRLA